MALASNTMHGHHLSNKLHPQLEPKETKLKLISVVDIATKELYVLYIASNTACVLIVDVLFRLGLSQLC